MEDKTRPLKELWEIIFYHTMNADEDTANEAVGICGIINMIKGLDLITSEEGDALLKDLQSYGKRLKSYYRFSGLKVSKIGLRSLQHMNLYYWPPYQLLPRIHWIKGRIKYHSKRQTT